MPERAGGADAEAVATALAVLEPLGDRVSAPAPIGGLTTYRVGGSAAILVTAKQADDLVAVGAAVAASGLPVLVIGKGSNLLVSDRGFAGIAVLLDPAGFGEVVIEGVRVRAGAAVPLPALARQTVEAGLTGFEWAVGVPGSVGGGVRMNAGGHGSDMAHTVRGCRLVDLHHARPAVVARALEELDYSYRHSSIQPHEVVVEAEFELAPGDPAQGRDTIREIVRWRREHQPGGQNAGSVFTNPPGDSAGRLIDEAGLKGRRWRTATVSEKHANFIQADGGGSADDVKALMDQIQEAVERTQGVRLAPEVRLIGFSPKSQPSVEG